MTDSEQKPSEMAWEFAKEYTRERWVRTFSGGKDDAQALLALLFDRAIQQAVQDEREACAKVVMQCIDGDCCAENIGQFCESYGCSTLFGLAEQIRSRGRK